MNYPCGSTKTAVKMACRALLSFHGLNSHVPPGDAEAVNQAAVHAGGPAAVL